MKKLVSLFLASLLSLSLFAFGPVTPMPPQEPDPIPTVTVQPEDPDRPGEPSADPQGPPDGNMPNPVPIEHD